MKSLWDFPSRTAAIEELGVEGFVAAAIRGPRCPERSPSSADSRAGEHPFARSHSDRPATRRREREFTFA